jgi:hypothetical protein
MIRFYLLDFRGLYFCAAYLPANYLRKISNIYTYEVIGRVATIGYILINFPTISQLKGKKIKKNSLNRQIKEGFLELWKNQMKQYSEGKLRTYTTFKVHFGFENYLSVIGNFDHRRCLTKLRISAHRLHIKTGRHQGIPPHQRLWGQCDSGEVEDDIHFLLCCSKFREERQQLFRTISQSCNTFLQLNPQEFFLLVNDL